MPITIAPMAPPPRAGVQTQTPEERAVRASGHRQPSIDGDLSAMDHAGPLLGFEPQACNENARALISMMARSTNRSNQRPGTLMQDRKAARSTKPLATHGRTIHRVKMRPCHSLRGHATSSSVRSGPAGPPVDNFPSRAKKRPIALHRNSVGSSAASVRFTDREACANAKRPISLRLRPVQSPPGSAPRSSRRGCR